MFVPEIQKSNVIEFEKDESKEGIQDSRIHSKVLPTLNQEWINSLRRNKKRGSIVEINRYEIGAIQ